MSSADETFVVERVPPREGGWLRRLFSTPARVVKDASGRSVMSLAGKGDLFDADGALLARVVRVDDSVSFWAFKGYGFHFSVRNAADAEIGSIRLYGGLFQKPVLPALRLVLGDDEYRWEHRTAGWMDRTFLIIRNDETAGRARLSTWRTLRQITLADPWFLFPALCLWVAFEAFEETTSGGA